MSADSPESLTHESMEDVSLSKKDMPRKRSKVSRACDACRRKKIRCNAEFSSTLSKVTQMCTNCSKTGEHCLFSRTPLKRGPSKGYIRDLVDHIDGPKEGHGFRDGVDGDNYRPRSQSMDGMGVHFYSHNGLKADSYQNSPPSPISQTSAKPQFSHRPKFSSTSHITQPIILPPIVGPQPSTQAVKLSLPVPKYATSVSPHSGGISLPNLPNPMSNALSGDHLEHRIQGPLWKVPYEMPSSGTPRSNISSPGVSNGVNFDSRRSSVDSVSSISTSGSVSRLPSLQPQSSLNSDSDDSEAASSRVVSPRNSVSSLSSLNGRVTHQLNISSNEPVPLQVQQQSELPTPPPMQFFPHSIPSQPPQTDPRASFHRGPLAFATSESVSPSNGKPPTSLLQIDLKTYYASIHAGFPILPFDEFLITRMIDELQAKPETQPSIIGFFATSLNNLIRYQIVSSDAIRDSLLHFNRIYPFASAPRNEALYLTFAALLMINYTILLRGDSCSTAIAAANGLFTDFKVLQTYRSLTSAELSEMCRDDIQLYLPRLHLCLQIIDSCHALSWGSQSQIKRPSTFSLAYMPEIFSEKYMGMEFSESREIGQLFEKLEAMKYEELFDERPRRKRWPHIVTSPEYTDRSNIASRLIRLQKDKFELFDFAIEVSHFFENHSKIDFEDEYTKDHIHDYQLKTSRLAKKLSQSILGFVNHISSTRIQPKHSSISDTAEQVNPFLNISFGQCLRLIKISKVLVESLIENSGDNETISRSTKIINDLSIATNLLIGDINQSSSRIENSRLLTERINQSGLPEHQNQFILQGPGISAIQLFSRQINAYDLSFSSARRSASTEKKGAQAWKDDFLEITNCFISREDINGWL